MEIQYEPTFSLIWIQVIVYWNIDGDVYILGLSTHTYFDVLLAKKVERNDMQIYTYCLDLGFQYILQ